MNICIINICVFCIFIVWYNIKTEIIIIKIDDMSLN